MASSLTARILDHPGCRESVLSAAYMAAMALDDELATVRTYLDVQALRMAGRMTYQVSAEPGLERVSVPETPEGGVSAELWIPAAAREAVAG